MIQKNNNCLYCGEKMESVRATKKFCSEQHRLYYWREFGLKKETNNATVTEAKVKEKEQSKVKDLTKPTNEVKPTETPKTNFSVDTTKKEVDMSKCPANLTGIDRTIWKQQQQEQLTSKS